MMDLRKLDLFQRKPRPNDWSGRTFPHAPGRQFYLGDARWLAKGTPLMNVMRLAQGERPWFEIKAFGRKTVIVTGGALAAELCDEKRFLKALPPPLEVLREFVGDALFTAYSHEQNWHTAHGILMPAFTKTAMRGYHQTMTEVIEEMITSWDGNTGPIDITSQTTKLTMETISRCAFSRDFGSFTSAEPHPFIGAMIAALTTGMRKANLDSVPWGRFVARKIDKENVDVNNYVDTLVDDIVMQRRASGGRTDDLLDRLLHEVHPETGLSLDDTNIRQQILTFLVAGHETTSGALSFALYYLSQNPECLARAQAETDELLGAQSGAMPTFEQVPKFRYLRRVLDESLRLWPTAPAFGRSPRESTILGEGTDYEARMDPDDFALVVLPLVHRDPEVWGPTADEFDPDRFLPENARGRMAHTYKPFGTGERACIGRQFALHEAVLVLARLLHSYDIVGDPQYELKVDERLTIVPKGFQLEFRPRVRVAETSLT